MKIPLEDIQSNRKYIESLNNIKFIHFRDLYPTIDATNFQICTKVDFKAIKCVHNHILETWNRLKNQHKDNLQPDKFMRFEITTKSGSQYFVTNDGNVYRLSNHWGAVSTCEWTREGKGELRMSVFISGDWKIGVANLKDFKIFRREVDRKVDVIVNPKWIENIKKIIPLKEKLKELIENPEFNELKLEDKQLIGQSYGYFKSTLKLVK